MPYIFRDLTRDLSLENYPYAANGISPHPPSHGFRHLLPYIQKREKTAQTLEPNIGAENRAVGFVVM